MWGEFTPTSSKITSHSSHWWNSICDKLHPTYYMISYSMKPDTKCNPHISLNYDDWISYDILKQKLLCYFCCANGDSIRPELSKNQFKLEDKFSVTFLMGLHSVKSQHLKGERDIYKKKTYILRPCVCFDWLHFLELVFIW